MLDNTTPNQRLPATLEYDDWSIDDAADLYGIQRWGNSYFGVSPQGKVTANTLNTAVPLLDIVEGLIDRDIHMPLLLRIENILDAQIYRLNDAFSAAIDETQYQNQYRGVYPIKVNQQAQVVEEIADFGARFHHGFEVGSKAELIAAMAAMVSKKGLLICNGYKDQEFIELGLQARRVGLQCLFVLETPNELDLIIECSHRLSITPVIGVRLKMSSQVGGHWNSTSGDRSIFGLTSMQLIDVVDQLRKENLLDCFQLLHCHLGSQIPNIRDIRAAVAEASRFYADLIHEGVPLKYIDFGGGLAVDYTGNRSNEDQSRNYSLAEYATGIVETLKQSLDQKHIPHPIIVTESGRSTVAYSSILLFNILDTTCFEASKKTTDSWLNNPAHKDCRNDLLIQNLISIFDYVSEPRLQECYNDALHYRQELRESFNSGNVNLRTLAYGEDVFLHVLQTIKNELQQLERIPTDLESLRVDLADIYYGNFSLFQSLPDIWAIDQIFPVMPIHRLNEKPERDAVLADITCDCDGKIDHFYVGAEPSRTLPLHSMRSGEEYYIGIFLVGAYQETLGDLHNLFGDTNVASVRLNADGSFDVVKEISGDTIADVLSYVEYSPSQLELNFRNTAEHAVKEGRISPRQRQEMIKMFKASLRGYTYFEKEQ